jgi:hypothetical protein
MLVGKSEGKSPLGSPRHRWANNIMMDLTYTGWGYMDCIGLSLDMGKWRALVNAVTDVWIPKYAG